MKLRSPRKIYLPLSVGLVLVLALGLGYKVIWHKPPSGSIKSDELSAKYISFSGGYLFALPAGYVANETAIAGVAIAYPEGLPTLNGKTLEELYALGAVAVQPIAQLKDNNDSAFKDYVNNTLATNLRKTLNSASDVREVSGGKIDAKEVFALDNSGKHLRVVMAINFSQPVLIAAADDSEPFKIIASTIGDLKKSKLKLDIDVATQATKTVLEMLQKQDVLGIRKKATAQFNKSVSNDKLKNDLKSSTSYLERSITITGGSYNGKLFIGELIFEPKASDQFALSGVVSLKKEGNSWKLDALQLPK
jgi:hypothetical protein